MIRRPSAPGCWPRQGWPPPRGPTSTSSTGTVSSGCPSPVRPRRCTVRWVRWSISWHPDERCGAAIGNGGGRSGVSPVVVAPCAAAVDTAAGPDPELDQGPTPSRESGLAPEDGGAQSEDSKSQHQRSAKVSIGRSAVGSRKSLPTRRTRKTMDKFLKIVGIVVVAWIALQPVSYTHLRAHETDSYLVCRLLLEK